MHVGKVQVHLKAPIDRQAGTIFLSIGLGRAGVTTRVGTAA